VVLDLVSGLEDDDLSERGMHLIAGRTAKHIPYLLASHVDLTHVEGMGSHSRGGLKPVTFHGECFEIVLCSNALH
jgi:hypothetical protein